MSEGFDWDKWNKEDDSQPRSVLVCGKLMMNYKLRKRLLIVG